MNPGHKSILQKKQLSQVDIDRWENEGGAFAKDPAGRHYGRRIESDRSWTVYHVYTGIPAHIAGAAMIGLSKATATSSMLSLNENGRIELPHQSGLGMLPEIDLKLSAPGGHAS